MREYTSNKQRGTAQTEYLSLFALIVIASLTAIALFGESVQQQFSNLAGEIAGKQTSSATDPFPQTPTTNADPDNAESGGVIHNATRAAQGLYDGLITQGEGFLQMALHPIDTLEGIATLAYALITDTEATLKMLKAQIGNDIDALTSGDPYEVARIVGEE